MTRKDLIGRLIENALTTQGIPDNEELPPLEIDPAWTGLEETFALGIEDLSTRVDAYLYEDERDEE